MLVGGGNLPRRGAQLKLKELAGGLLGICISSLDSHGLLDSL